MTKIFGLEKVLTRRVRDSPEFRETMDDVFDRLPDFFVRVATVKVGARGSAEEHADIGNYWMQARLATGKSAHEIARLIGVEFKIIHAFETGLFTGEELSRLPQAYANAIGQPDLYAQFKEQFKR